MRTFHFLSVRSAAFVITAFAVAAVSVGAYRTASYRAELLADPQEQQMASEETVDMVASSSDVTALQQEEFDMTSVSTDEGDIIDEAESVEMSPFDGEILLEGEVQDGDIPLVSEDGYEYVGTAVCTNTSVKQKVNATGRTQLRTYGSGKAQKKIDQRCSRSDAEASAQVDGMEAFKNSCGLPPQCQNQAQCEGKGIRFQYDPNPPKITYGVKELRADPIMKCAGGKSYHATAQVTGDCTSVRYCEEAKKGTPRY